MPDRTIKRRLTPSLGSRPDGNVSKSNAISNNISVRAVRQLGVQDTVKAAGLVFIAAERVLVYLGSGANEVVCLFLHGPKTTYLLYKPVHGLPTLLRAKMIRDLMVLVIFRHYG